MLQDLIPASLRATYSTENDENFVIKTEEKALVVAAVWGTEFVQFLAALDIFHQVDFEEKE